MFGLAIDPGPEPAIDFEQGQTLRLGSNTLEVRFTPGHTPGHCIFYCAEAKTCFTGDLIFAGSVGRTDFPGGSWEQLEHSIRSQVYSLPDDTRLLSGHGELTTVGREKASNPFVQE